MRFPSRKRAVRVYLLALFIASLGIFATIGQVSAAPANASWQNNQCHKQDDNGHWKCHDGSSNHDRYYNCNSSDSDANFCDHASNYDNCQEWDPNSGYCMLWTTGSRYDTCREWDSHSGYCMLWVTGAYIDNSHDFPYNNLAGNGCDQWDTSTGLCTHWQVNLSPGYHAYNN
jgi:hypothetical protein